jgi:hypothetical protein
MSVAKGSRLSAAPYRGGPLEIQIGEPCLGTASRLSRGSTPTPHKSKKIPVFAFTRKIAFELGPYGINVNTIAPSRALTERIRPRWEQQSPERPSRRNRKDAVAAHRRGPNHTKVICFVASGDADFRHWRDDRRDRRKLTLLPRKPHPAGGRGCDRCGASSPTPTRCPNNSASRWRSAAGSAFCRRGRLLCPRRFR